MSYTCRSFRDAGQGGVAAFDYLNSRGGWIRSARPTRKGGLIVLVILGGGATLAVSQDVLKQSQEPPKKFACGGPPDSRTHPRPLETPMSLGISRGAPKTRERTQRCLALLRLFRAPQVSPSQALNSLWSASSVRWPSCSSRAATRCVRRPRCGPRTSALSVMSGTRRLHLFYAGVSTQFRCQHVRLEQKS